MGTARQIARRLTYAWLIATPLLLLAACGGSDADEPTVEPTSAASPVATGTTEVTSFRYQLNIELTGVTVPFYFEQSGEVVLPDREHAKQTYEVGLLAQETDRITIGENVWLKGDLPWVDLGASPLGVLGSGIGASAAFEGWGGSVEELDGQPTTRFGLTAKELVQLTGAPTDAIDDSTTGSIWISHDYQIPVRMLLEARGEGTEEDGSLLRMELRVLEINGSDIAVDEPTVAQTANLQDGVTR